MQSFAKLADFFVGTPELLPVPPKPGVMTQPWVSRIRLALTRLYWSKRDPVVYLKCVCSEATALLGKQLKLDLTDTITASARCDVLTTQMRSAAYAAANNEPMVRHINRFTTTFSALEWAGGRDVTEAVQSHVVFIWAVAMALGREDLDTDPTTEENLRWLNQCVPHFTRYVECIAKLQQR